MPRTSFQPLRFQSLSPISRSVGPPDTAAQLVVYTHARPKILADQWVTCNFPQVGCLYFRPDEDLLFCNEMKTLIITTLIFFGRSWLLCATALPQATQTRAMSDTMRMEPNVKAWAAQKISEGKLGESIVEERFPAGQPARSHKSDPREWRDNQPEAEGGSRKRDATPHHSSRLIRTNQEIQP